MKIRQMKKTLWSRRFVSNAHWPLNIGYASEKEWLAACRAKFRPKIHGLAFNDARSQQRRRHVPHGRHALLILPIDDLHMDRKREKKIQRQISAEQAAAIDAWRAV